MPTADRTLNSPPEVGIGGLVDSLRTRLGRYKRTQINRIAHLGGVVPSQIYAFRKGGARSRIYMDTVTRIEKGLSQFEQEQVAP